MPEGGWRVHVSGDSVSHYAFLYRDANEYEEHTLAFVQEGLARREPVFVALPGGHPRRMPAAAETAGRQLAVADMNELGRNPARITLALGIFASQYPAQRVRIVTEPLWPGRTAAEAAEVMKHEALVAQAVAPSSAAILCPYDASRLGAAFIEGACRTHPGILEGGHRRRSRGYLAGPPPEPELPAPPASAEFLAYRSRLYPVRALAGRYAERAGLPDERRADLVLAVSEVTANTLTHTAGGGTVHIWASAGEVICQVHDSGWITDPLAGRRRPPPDSTGQGLWVVNQVCDLVETRTGPAGTTTQLRFRLPGARR